MKKLKLSLRHIDGAEVLTREQLKAIRGGAGEPCGYGNQPFPDVYMSCADPTESCVMNTCTAGPGGSGEGGSGSTRCWDRPMNEQCHGSTYGCCAGTAVCINSAGGYICI